MARIRTIKPEFWTSEQIAECSPNTRLLFIGLWTFCDDGGVHPASAARAKMEIFPADAFSREDIEAMISELIEVGLIHEYEVGGRRYWRVSGWKHQKIDQPTYRHPQPDGRVPESPIRRRTNAKCSANIQRTDGECSILDLDLDLDMEEKNARARAIDAPVGAVNTGKKKSRARTEQVKRPDNIDPQVWSDYLAARRAKRAPLTGSAWAAIRKQIDLGVAAGHDPDDMLREAMAAGWQGFRLDWYENRVASRTQGSPAADGARRVWDSVVAAASRGREGWAEWREENPEYRDAVAAVGGLQQIGLMNEWQQREAKAKFLEIIGGKRV